MKALAGVGDDRISQLPEEVLCHILSFIPTLDAVQTTILSKRWNKLWKFVPNLDFIYSEDVSFSSTHQFTMFVDSVLSSRGSSDIRGFRLYIDFRECFSRKLFPLVDSWICSAIRNNAIELDVTLYTLEEAPDDEYPHEASHSEWSESDDDSDSKTDLYLDMPQCVYTSKTLLILKVDANCVIYSPPAFGCFPCLKYLHVSSGLCASITSIHKLFCNCPVLEDLAISALNASLNINAPELKSLKADGGFHGLYGCFRNSGYSLVISAPKLEKLDVSDNRPNYCLESSKSLSTIRFRSSSSDLSADCCAALMAAISTTVKDMTFYVPCFLPLVCRLAFNNLNKLKLVFSDDSCWEWLPELLNVSPNVENLILKFDIDPASSEVTFLGPSEVVPICLSSRIKNVILRDCKGLQNEIDAAKYLLKYGEVMNKMTVSHSQEKEEMTLYAPRQIEDSLCREEDFLSLPKASSTCQIEFVKD